MATADNPYSHFVAGAKVVLPLAALALLATLFLFARGSGGDGPDIPYAEIEEIAREARLSNAAYDGMAEDGSVISIRAETMQPEDGAPRTFVIRGLSAQVTAPDGTGLTVQAPDGRIDTLARAARFTGLARVEATNGWEMETEGIEADLTAGEVRSLGALEVHAPFGTFQAGGMAASTHPESGASQVVFSGGVSLVYTPDQ